MPKDLFQRRIRIFGQNDLQMHILIAALATALVDDPFGAQAKCRSGIRAFGHSHGHGAIDRRHRYLTTEPRFRWAHRQVQMHVIVFALEDVVRPDMQLDEGIARLASLETGLALTLQPKRLTIAGAGGNSEVEIAPVSAITTRFLVPLAASRRSIVRL